MKTVITLQELNEADLRPFKEVWLTSAQALAETGHCEDQLCLWRSTEAFTHDMLSEGTHDQNLNSAWLVIDDIDDSQQVLDIENAVRQRLDYWRLPGEFYPAELGEQHASRRLPTPCR